MRNLLIFISVFVAFGLNSQNIKSFTPGEIWPDKSGKHINAHGGGIIFYNNTYYWFGEHKSDTTGKALVGVNCYSSRDLYNWKYQSVALAVVDDTNSPITKGCIIERPKVVYNAKTKKFVMWFHNELKDKGYDAAQSGVAISDNIKGPYKLIRSSRANKGKFPLNMPDKMELPDNFDFNASKNPLKSEVTINGYYLRRDLESGQMTRDMTVYVDDDIKAYHIYASENNQTLQIAELTTDYTDYTGKYIRVDAGGANEAPAIFKKEGTYFMVTSGCTGWAPNAGRLLSSKSMLGEWTRHDNPFVGENSNKSFDSQSTYILKVNDNFIYMGDRWNAKKLSDSRYIWLPIQFEKGLPVIKWLSEWDLSFFK